jgi:DNA-binding MarR family transcriptional regulator
MSHKYLEKAMECPIPMTSAERLVLWYLADSANGEGKVIISARQLAKAVGLVERSARRIAKSLEQKKVIKIQPMFRNDGGCYGNSFLIC